MVYCRKFGYIELNRMILLAKIPILYIEAAGQMLLQQKIWIHSAKLDDSTTQEKSDFRQLNGRGNTHVIVYTSRCKELQRLAHFG